MSNYRLWPIAVLVIAVMFFFWDGEDQPDPDKSTQQESRPAVSTSTMWQPEEAHKAPGRDVSGGYPAPVDPYGNYSYGYNTSTEQNTRQFSSPDGLRFRPQENTIDNLNQYQSSHQPIQGQGYSITTSDPAYQELQGYDTFQQPGGGNYRFRPLNKKRQEKRWHGNYGQMRTNPVQPSTPYPYNRYPAPAYPYQSAPEPNPLWANSWPDR